eukprot:25410-Chlamydomonas_euryale.AAC.1
MPATAHGAPAEYDKHVRESGDHPKAGHDTLLTPPVRNKAAMSISCKCVADRPRLSAAQHGEAPTLGQDQTPRQM